MKREEIEVMLDGIDETYILEASGDYVRKSRMTGTKKIAVAVIAFLFITGTSVSIMAAANPNFREWIQSFSIKETDYDGSKGVCINRKENDQNASTEEHKKEDTYYLKLEYIPDGYQCDEKETYIYYGENEDTDYFLVAYFHLQADFINILPGAKKVEKYETDDADAYLATSKYENRLWILFKDGDYMVEIRDGNKKLSKKQIEKIVDGASITNEQQKVKYEMLEWTQELKESYENWLKKY